MKRCCGTCKWFGVSEVSGYVECTFPVLGSFVGKWLAQEDRGKDCPRWSQSETIEDKETNNATA